MSGLKISASREIPVKMPENVSRKKSSEFGGVLNEAIGKIDNLERETDRSVVDLLRGKTDIHETMIGLQKLDISVRLLLTIRNKAVEAYKEIMRMQY